MLLFKLDRLMGETSDDVKEKAQEFADKQVEKAKTVAERAYEEARRRVQYSAQQRLKKRGGKSGFSRHIVCFLRP